MINQTEDAKGDDTNQQNLNEIRLEYVCIHHQSIKAMEEIERLREKRRTLTHLLESPRVATRSSATRQADEAMGK
jgi:hypothetical protein